MSDDLPRRFDALIGALVERALVPARLRDAVSRVRADERPRVHLAIYGDKYQLESPDIDCAARLHLCGGRCCSFDVLLSEQDVEEGGIPWVLDRPYELPRDRDTRRCACMDEAGACTIYDRRPGACRTYDCREDRRVWIDFAARIPAPRG
ncbi:MAG: YkgJ family cysteine cluster protein [Myxococcales bacterium]|nr:YkgJ family cysteine cluster protein [Myxococcales bacterium]